MTDEVIGLDPSLLNNCEFSPARFAPPEGVIAPGSQNHFAFMAGQPLEKWTVTSSYVGQNPDIHATPEDNYLHFQGTNAQGWEMAATQQAAMTLSQTILTIAFPIRVGQANPGARAFIKLPGGLVIDVENEVYGYFASQEPRPFVSLDVSTGIPGSTDWTQVVMAIQSNAITVWENDEQKLTWTLPEPLGGSLAISFGMSMPGGSYAFDLGNFWSMLGTTQTVRQKRGVDQEGSSAISSRSSAYNAIWPQVEAAEEAAASLIATLKNVSIGPSALFWGISVSPELKSAFDTFNADPRVAALQSAVRQHFPDLNNSAAAGGFTFSISIGMTGAVILSGGYQIGFLIGTEGVSAFLMLEAGGVTNVEIGASLAIAFYPMGINQVLGSGCYVQIGGGEFINGHIAVSGNIPLHFRAWDNCGPGFDIGAGVGISPFEVGGGFSYTFQIAKL